MIEDLVMDPDRKDILVSLASSFSRKDKAVNPIADRFWSADFVQGKGSGLIFLLHGHPGVGKTCTAGERNPIGIVLLQRVESNC